MDDRSTIRGKRFEYGPEETIREMRARKLREKEEHEARQAIAKFIVDRIEKVQGPHRIG